MAIKWRSKKFLFTAIGALVIIVAVVLMSSGSSSEATQIQADLAYNDDIAEIVSASGRIQPQTKVDITSEVSAQVMSIFVKEGDLGRTRPKLILLDTIQLQSDVSQARYSLDEISPPALKPPRPNSKSTSSNPNARQKLFERDLELRDRGHQRPLWLRKLQRQLPRHALPGRDRAAGIEKAEDNLTKTLIKAPMPGVMTFLSVEVGEISQAQTAFTQGKTLMTIADLSVFEVEIDVDESEIAKIVIGQKAKIKVDAFRDTAFAGTVVEIGNSALVAGQGSDNYTTSFRVKVRFDKAEVTFRPGMSATVDITTE